MALAAWKPLDFNTQAMSGSFLDASPMCIDVPAILFVI